MLGNLYQPVQHLIANCILLVSKYQSLYYDYSEYLMVNINSQFTWVLSWLFNLVTCSSCFIYSKYILNIEHLIDGGGGGVRWLRMLLPDLCVVTESSFCFCWDFFCLVFLLFFIYVFSVVVFFFSTVQFIDCLKWHQCNKITNKEAMHRDCCCR